MTMFDADDSYSNEFNPNQMIECSLRDDAGIDLQHLVTLIGTREYGLEVEMSGFVSVEREVSEAETFLARLYKHG